MGVIHYNVPMTRQEQSPICWIACVAMIISFKRAASIGVGEFTGGFDPSNSSIANPVTGWTDFYNRLVALGFTSEGPEMTPHPSYVEQILVRYGPFMLTHFAYGFPYEGPQCGPRYGSILDPNSTHAVVVTGLNTRTGTAWFNNPWGDIDEPIAIEALIAAINAMVLNRIRPIAYMLSA